MVCSQTFYFHARVKIVARAKENNGRPRRPSMKLTLTLRSRVVALIFGKKSLTYRLKLFRSLADPKAGTQFTDNGSSQSVLPQPPPLHLTLLICKIYTRAANRKYSTRMSRQVAWNKEKPPKACHRVARDFCCHGAQTGVAGARGKKTWTS